MQEMSISNKILQNFTLPFLHSHFLWNGSIKMEIDFKEWNCGSSIKLPKPLTTTPCIQYLISHIFQYQNKLQLRFFRTKKQYDNWGINVSKHSAYMRKLTASPIYEPALSSWHSWWWPWCLWSSPLNWIFHQHFTNIYYV